MEISATVEHRNSDPIVSLKDKRAAQDKQIRDLYSLGWTYQEISDLFKVSKTTVFKALKGRTSNSQ